LFVYESEFWFHHFLRILQQVQHHATRKPDVLNWFVENATKFKRYLMKSLIQITFSGYHRDLQLLKEGCFQRFKTWKPVWISRFCNKDIKVTIFLRIKIQLFVYGWYFKRNGSCWNAF
jgi:hypothetical protein